MDSALILQCDRSKINYRVLPAAMLKVLPLPHAEARFFSDKGVYFYINRGYVEIKNNFKGKMSIPLLGAARNSLFKWLGHPEMKDETWDAFETAYGTLVLNYNKAGKMDHLEITTKSTETMNLYE